MQITQELLMISMSNLWQEVQNQIPHISFEDNLFESTSGMREWRHWKFQSLISPLGITISNINAQFAPVNKDLNSASIMLQQFFRKYFRNARMTSLKFSKCNFSAAVDNIYAQFAPVNRGLNSAYIMLQQLFSKVLPVCANDVIEIFKV